MSPGGLDLFARLGIRAWPPFSDNVEAGLDLIELLEDQRPAFRRWLLQGQDSHIQVVHEQVCGVALNRGIGHEEVNVRVVLQGVWRPLVGRKIHKLTQELIGVALGKQIDLNEVIELKDESFNALPKDPLRLLDLRDDEYDLLLA